MDRKWKICRQSGPDLVVVAELNLSDVSGMDRHDHGGTEMFRVFLFDGSIISITWKQAAALCRAGGHPMPTNDERCHDEVLDMDMSQMDLDDKRTWNEI